MTKPKAATLLRHTLVATERAVVFKMVVFLFLKSSFDYFEKEKASILTPQGGMGGKLYV